MSGDSKPNFYPIKYTKKNFEIVTNSIVSFTKTLLSRNLSHGINVTRELAQWHWDGEVYREYPDDEEKRTFLLDQKICPGIEVFWGNHTDAAAFAQRLERANSGCFEESAHALSAAQEEKYPWALHMEDTNGSLIVPDILLLPMHRLQYTEFVRKVAAANAEVNVDFYRMRSLWGSIISTAYGHECECKQQKMLRAAQDVGAIAYRALVEAGKASISSDRKRSASPKSSSDSDSEAEKPIKSKRARPYKRTRRSLQCKIADQTPTKSAGPLNPDKSFEAVKSSDTAKPQPLIHEMAVPPGMDMRCRIFLKRKKQPSPTPSIDNHPKTQRLGSPQKPAGDEPPLLAKSVRTKPPMEKAKVPSDRGLMPVFAGTTAIYEGSDIDE